MTKEPRLCNVERAGSSINGAGKSRQAHAKEWNYSSDYQLLEGGENGEMLTKGCKLSVLRWVSNEDLMHSMVIVANNMIKYTWKLLQKGRS